MKNSTHTGECGSTGVPNGFTVNDSYESYYTTISIPYEISWLIGSDLGLHFRTNLTDSSRIPGTQVVSLNHTWSFDKS